MTAGCASAFSRRRPPESCPSSLSLSKTEGAGKAGCALHPRSHVQHAHLARTHTSIQVQRRASGLPCAMVLTAYSVLSPATNSSCHRRQRIDGTPIRLDRRPFANLTPATGARTTRLCRTLQRRSSGARRSLTNKVRPATSLARRRCRVHRIPRPTFVTMANAPLCGHETSANTPVICLARKQKYF